MNTQDILDEFAELQEQFGDKIDDLLLDKFACENIARREYMREYRERHKPKARAAKRVCPGCGATLEVMFHVKRGGTRRYCDVACRMRAMRTRGLLHLEKQPNVGNTMPISRNNPVIDFPRRSGEVYLPSDHDRVTVKKMAAARMAQEKIATVLGITIPTLRKYYLRELEIGAIEADAAVADAILREAKRGNMKAAELWAKSQMQWTEKQQVEVQPGIAIEYPPEDPDE